eukprot:CAMPEP_0196997340 /NCGR_PEP_ID=MMETSP1380-20130617/2979_1 /TAXON_ID=5936 /ORGANISM="Euplotes crassus, Strain CT5" /LENGTH=84 /DNA_ID=CAMNT_0042413541 /DNA_START=17 /DNA_END=271 /DNA_ORIENTATION=+
MKGSLDLDLDGEIKQNEIDLSEEDALAFSKLIYGMLQSINYTMEKGIQEDQNSQWNFKVTTLNLEDNTRVRVAIGEETIRIVVD